MPLGEFMDRAWKGLCEDLEQIPVGTAAISFERWEGERQSEMRELLERISGGGGK